MNRDGTNGVHTNGYASDDDDLKDLLGKKKYHTTTNKVSPSQQPPSLISTAMGTLNYHVHTCCFFYPVTCGIITFGIVAMVLWLLFSAIINPTEVYGIIHHDHSNIASKYDLRMQDIEHWCLGGRDDTCTCEDPLIPIPRSEHSSWILAYKGNRKKIDHFLEESRNPDVAFLGGSIIEEMDGRWLGVTARTVGLKKIQNVFQRHFNKALYPASAKADGIALGIAGDTSPNVLWRLMHGEMPDDFNPKVWWLELGMNDLARTKCSEEVVVLGILRIVEEIIEQRPKAHIVINSLLPMTTLRGDFYPVISDVEDSFTEKADKTKLDTKESDSNRRQLDKKNKTDESMEKIKVAAENEEAIRDKKKKKRENKFAVILKDKTKIRKYKAGRVRQNKIPLWTSVKAINKALENFALKHKGTVSFFNATDIFVENKKNMLVLRTERTSAKGHPTIPGFIALEDEMTSFLDTILTNLHVSDDQIPYEAFSRGDDYELNRSPLGDEPDGDDNMNSGNGTDDGETLKSGNDDQFGSGDDGSDWLNTGDLPNDDYNREIFLPENFDDDQYLGKTDDMAV